MEMWEYLVVPHEPGKSVNEWHEKHGKDGELRDAHLEIREFIDNSSEHNYTMSPLWSSMKFSARLLLVQIRDNGEEEPTRQLIPHFAAGTKQFQRLLLDLLWSSV